MNLKERIALNSANIMLFIACLASDLIIWALLQEWLGSVRSYFAALTIAFFMPFFFRRSNKGHRR